jgi:hypothetical protein
MKPKIFVKNFNGVMDGILKSGEFEKVLDPRDSDAIVLWQDVRGECAELCRINKEYMKKPVVVVQHGAGGARDYEHPENFPLLADKWCCWGQHDYERLVRQGHGDRAVITGSPIINQLKPKEEHIGKNIIFCPIVTEHEEPANLIVFYELKKIEFDCAQKKIIKNKYALQENWNPKVFTSKSHLEERTIPYHNISTDFRLISKLTPMHDKSLYFGSVVETNVVSKTHIEDCVKLLANADVVVGMVESTFQMLAMAMCVPVVISKEWEFKIYAGKDYTNCDHLKTDAATYAETKDLREVIEQELSNPERLKENRKKTVLRELGDVNSDPDKNIIKVIKETING